MSDIITRNRALAELGIKNQPGNTAVLVVAAANINLSSLPATIDGATPPVGSLFLAAGQSTSAQNGVYNYVGVGLAATRAEGWDTQDDFVAGKLVTPTAGTTYADTLWVLQAAVTTLDVSDVLFDEQADAVGPDSADLISYGNGSSGLSADNVQDAIDEVYSAIPTDAAEIFYDNTDSGLAANQVQAAIDELAASSGGGSSVTAVRARADGNIDLITLPATVDNISLSNGELFVAADQGTPASNGVYVYAGAGNPATRAPSWDSAESITAGKLVVVTQGDVFANTLMAVQADIAVLDTDTILIEVCGFDFTKVPVEFTPYIDNQVQFGTDNKRFKRGYINELLNIGTGGGPENVNFAYSGTAPSGATGSVIRAAKSSDLINYSQNNDEIDSNPTRSLIRETGNKEDGTGDSGSIIDQTGTSAGGARGKQESKALGFQITTIDAEPAADVSLRGMFRVVQNGTGVADTIRVCIKDATDTYVWVTVTAI